MEKDEKAAFGRPTASTQMEALEKRLHELGERTVIGKVLTEATWIEGILTKVIEAHMPEKSKTCENRSTRTALFRPSPIR